MSSTVTIRVPRATRDTLAELATHSSESISRYLERLADDERRRLIIAAACREPAEIAASPQAQREFELWEGAVSDGI